MAKRKMSKSEATRGLIIDAALEVIGHKGYSAATVDQIVEVAGVSKGVVYYHFSSKAEMATSVLERGLAELTEGFDRIAKEAPTARDAMLKFIQLFAQRVFENKNFGRFFTTELWRNDRDWSESLRSHEQQLMSILTAQIRRGQAEGTVRPELDAEYVAVSMVGQVLTTSLFYTAGLGHVGGGAGVGSGSVRYELVDAGTAAERAPGDEMGTAGSPGSLTRGSQGESGGAAGPSDAQAERLALGKEEFVSRTVDFFRHACSVQV